MVFDWQYVSENNGRYRVIFKLIYTLRLLVESKHFSGTLKLPVKMEKMCRNNCFLFISLIIFKTSFTNPLRFVQNVKLSIFIEFSPSFRHLHAHWNTYMLIKSSLDDKTQCLSILSLEIFRVPVSVVTQLQKCFRVR